MSWSAAPSRRRGMGSSMSCAEDSDDSDDAGEEAMVL